MKLSVVAPVHDEADVLPEFITRVQRVTQALDADSEIVIVDDGSEDGSWTIICNAARDGVQIRGLRLSRNFGHQIALTAGIQAAQGDAVITLDSDLQHPPEVIPALLEKAAEGFDVVYAVRGARDSESWFKRASAAAFYRVLNWLTALDLPSGGADFRYMSRRVVAALMLMPERHRFLRGMTRWVGFAQDVVEYERAPRRAGTRKYTLNHMIRFGWDAIIAFSSVPLRLASFFGFLVSLLGLLYLVYVLGVRLFTDDTVEGWTSVVAAVLLLGGVQLICIGIIGQYVGRMYEETKNRPLFLIADDTAGDEAARFSRPEASRDVATPSRSPRARDT